MDARILPRPEDDEVPAEVINNEPFKQYCNTAIINDYFTNRNPKPRANRCGIESLAQKKSRDCLEWLDLQRIAVNSGHTIFRI